MACIMRLLLIVVALILCPVGYADEQLPQVPAGFRVEVFASEPLVRNWYAIRAR